MYHDSEKGVRTIFRRRRWWLRRNGVSRSRRGKIVLTPFFVILLAAGCRPDVGSEGATTKAHGLQPVGFMGQEDGKTAVRPKPSDAKKSVFVGSKSCRDCHEEFYKLWAVSNHGLAMQPFTPELAKGKLTPQTGYVTIGQRKYRAEITGDGPALQGSGFRVQGSGSAAGHAVLPSPHHPLTRSPPLPATRHPPPATGQPPSATRYEPVVREVGPDGQRTYPIAFAMGGKNIYYFLAPLERGRLQVLPVAYDVHKKAWYDTAASGVRHFPDRRDEALPWTDRMFTFNTTCFNCHVSRLATNYDLATDTYRTTWGEPGISCESCHGPAGEHVRAMEAGEEGSGFRVQGSEARGQGSGVRGQGPGAGVQGSGFRVQGSGTASRHPPPATRRSSKEIKILRAEEFTAEQINDMCATCHAKMAPLSISFLPGDKFFDHYDLVTLENPDYYPDGRDLGENYTFTSWLMSPCARSGKLDCNHCHTPSGRPRFEGDKSNQMCLPCHEKEVKAAVEHGHHQPGSKGNECVGCHMPMTRFAAMARSDHSMRPPMPAATLAFKSPNACNLCHPEFEPAFADAWVRRWYPKDYQAATLRIGGLVDAARKDQWDRLPEVLAFLTDPAGDPVFKTSLVRLLRGCEDASKRPVLVQLLKDPSPLVRSSAASALADHLTPEVLAALLEATGDESRLVRIRSAMALAGVPPEMVTRQGDRQRLASAVAEFRTAMKARPDDWASYANLGNFSMEGRDFADAIAQFEIASRLEPRAIGPAVNAAICHSNLGQNEKAEDCLRRALKVEPTSAAVNFNLGLLLGEEERFGEAEQALRAALKTDPKMAAAAYNLGVIVAKRDVGEAIALLRKAVELRPGEPDYAYTLAFFQRQKGDLDGAAATLNEAKRRSALSADGCLLLGAVYEQKGDAKAAEALYREALDKVGLSPQTRAELMGRLGRVTGEARDPKPEIRNKSE
jgi:tetratricopeptide (TPR) repeat protein